MIRLQLDTQAELGLLWILKDEIIAKAKAVIRWKKKEPESIMVSIYAGELQIALKIFDDLIELRTGLNNDKWIDFIKHYNAIIRLQLGVKA